MDERMIKSPKYYTEGRKFEPKDVIRDWGLNFNLGNAVKYISRAGRKEDIIQDLKKAQQYLQFEIDAIEAERVHLCSSCKYECIAGCPADPTTISFGNGLGHDNVVGCKSYRKKEPAPNCRCTPEMPLKKGCGISFEEAIKHSEQMDKKKDRECINKIIEDIVAGMDGVELMAVAEISGNEGMIAVSCRGDLDPDEVQATILEELQARVKMMRK